MLYSVPQTVSLLIHSRYGLLFPAVLIEGPVATIIAGVLVAHDQLNFLISLLIIVSADTLADLGYYTIGAFGEARIAQRIKTRLGITPDRLSNLKNLFYRHSAKTFLTGKILHGPGVVILIAAGAARVSLLRFFLYNLCITLIKSLVLLLVGYYFGQALAFLQHWLDLSSLVASSIAIIIIITLIIRHNRHKKI
jgi:membrane protein DedA with SNARE-associated domain